MSIEDKITRQRSLYWEELKQLKAKSICIRLYRNEMNSYVKITDTILAIASSVSIGGWAIWNKYSFAWSLIIALSQVINALKGVFTFSKLHKSASALTISFETLYIDAEDDWEKISLRENIASEINDKRTSLRKLQLAAEQKFFPEGFEPSDKMIAKASHEAETYFSETYADLDDLSTADGKGSSENA